MGASGAVRDGWRSILVGLDADRCLDTAEFLARNAARYGIDADVELRRSRSARLPDRHYVLGRRPLDGPGRSVAIDRDDAATNAPRPLWIVQLTVRPDAVDDELTEVTVAVHRDRRWRPWRGPGRSAETYQQLLTEALVRLDRQRRTPRRARPWPDNVVALRPFDQVPPTASA